MNKLKCIPASLMFALIMTLSWYGRVVQIALRNLLGLEGLVLFVSVAAVIFIFVSNKIFKLRDGYIRLLLVFYPIGIYLLSANPEEAVHLMEYGAFALSLSYVFSDYLTETKTSVYAALGSITLGFLDEIFQGINPSRIFDLRDIVINSIGAVMTVALFTQRRVKQ